MTHFTPEELFRLLPAVHRLRDADEEVQEVCGADVGSRPVARASLAEPREIGGEREIARHPDLLPAGDEPQCALAAPDAAPPMRMSSGAPPRNVKPRASSSI